MPLMLFWWSMYIVSHFKWSVLVPCFTTTTLFLLSYAVFECFVQKCESFQCIDFLRYVSLMSYKIRVLMATYPPMRVSPVLFSCAGDLLWGQFQWKAGSRDRRLLVWVFAAAVGAVAALGHVEERVDVGIQLGHPVARHQERCQVEQIHKHFVAVTKGKENHSFNIELMNLCNVIRHLPLLFSEGQNET